jgi:hypothetical protein
MEDDEFVIELDFRPHSSDPSRVFRSMAGLIESCQQAERELARAIGARIEPVVVLESVEAGSIRSILRSIVESVDDEALKDGDWKKAVGRYLLKGKYALLRYLERKPDEVTRASIQSLQGELHGLAEATDVLRIPAYPRVPVERLVVVLQQFGESLLPLQEGDRVVFRSDEDEQALNREFRIPDELLDALTEAEVLENRSETILQVKKPDFIGNSMWELRHGSRTFPAKIAHEEWLSEFQNREIALRPGDAIRAVLETRVAYDEFGNVLTIHYVVTQVVEVIKARFPRQGLLPSGEDDQ